MKILVSRRVHVVREWKSKSVWPDWLEKVWVCNNSICACQFQLEKNDGKKVVAQIQTVDGGAVGTQDFIVHYVPCPGCGTRIEIDSRMYFGGRTEPEPAGRRDSKTKKVKRRK